MGNQKSFMIIEGNSFDIDIEIVNEKRKAQKIIKDERNPL